MANDNLDDILGKEPEATPIEETKDETKSDVKDEPVKEDKAKAKDDKPDAKEDDKDELRKVTYSHSALHEERERRKEAQRQAKEEKERNDRLEERQNKIFETLAGKQQPQQEEYIDPLQKLENEVNEVKGVIQKSQAQIDKDRKDWAEEQNLVNKYRSSAIAFTKDAPDFVDARNFLIADKTKELVALDYTQEEIEAEIKLIEKQIVQRAYNQEKNPAEVVYKLAKEKGYKQKEPEKKIEDIDKGLKASKSLQGGSSGIEESLKTLSAADLRDMSEEEFNAFFSKIEKQAKKSA